MKKADHVLIVDDDPEIRQLLTDYLQGNGYRTSAAADGEEMRRLLLAVPVDIVVLDLMLPGDDGLTLCRELRKRSNTPVIMLTARGTLIDRIVGLEVGADDYLPKPFDPRELLARIKVILRRARSFPEQSEIEQIPYIHFAGWRLDTQARQMLSPKGVTITLGGSDYLLLRELLNHPNRTLSRDYLLGRVYDKESAPFDRAIDVCISRLRQQLDDDPRAPSLIRTVRNAGYMLTAVVDPQA
ncbi:response regulator [Janthinobacterium agaricidamnosum]|uniref:Response regulator n=1 Tax=Janthinobacterium agaricidamnosum NBRC 102515 = DSM 9628 TaxID=1349767 RepID=W0UWR2_9BURK|nr:response regulator transcription factor [Janthinobacterium agaricidamnosum]CDG80874.1 response regulator [Janthinobacterium agaricidamnosum NBRC 102515 = DSM 9628]